MLRIPFTEEAIATLHYERYHYPDPKVQKKFEVLWLKSQNLPHETIAQLSGVSSRTVQRYLREYLEGGIERLKQNQYVGAPSLLNPTRGRLKSISRSILPRPQPRLRKPSRTWQGCDAASPRCVNFLTDWEWSVVKWDRHPVKPTIRKNSGNNERFSNGNWIRVWTRRNRANAKFFGDASHFVFGAFLCYLWCFVRFFLRTPAGRQRYNVLGALDYVSKRLTTVVNTTYINAKTVSELLQTLAEQHSDTPITLVMDNARYQRTALVQEKAKTLGIELLFLPSYSPNLNLIERVWKFVKSECLGGKH
jgi:transposase